MADFPALPLFTDAYLSDTRHLTTIEHGAYLLLMMEAWRRPSCALPDDDKLLARLAQLTEAEWLEIKDTVMAFWKYDGRKRMWMQKRLSRERKFVSDKRKVQRDKAAKRWKNKKKQDATAVPETCPSDAPTPTPTPTPFSSKEEKESSRSSSRAGAREADQLYDRVLAAVKLGASPLPTHWMPPAASLHVERWRSQLGLTADQIVDVASHHRARHDDPPGGPKALDHAMQSYAAEVHAPPMHPEAGTGGRSPPGRAYPHVVPKLPEEDP